MLFLAPKFPLPWKMNENRVEEPGSELNLTLSGAVRRFE